MTLFEWLNKIDTNWLLGINGCNSDFFNAFFSFFTAKETWFPFYVLLLIMVFRKYKMRGLWVALFLIVTIVLTDQFSGFIKDTVERLRPSHAPALEGLLNLPTGTGGSYGFVSSHAANAFGLGVFVALLAKSKRLWGALMLWALLTGYSRMYVGVHYPFDVLCGAMLGIGVAIGMFVLLKMFDNRFLQKKIGQEGSWKPAESWPLLLALIFTTVTLLTSAQLMVK